MGLNLQGSPPNNYDWLGNSQMPRIGSWSRTSSKHVGGIHILMGDGAVRFLSENVAAVIRVHLDRIADGNVLDAF